MPSLDNRAFADFDRDDEPDGVAVRPIIEWIFRAVGLITLLLLIWQALHVLHVRPTARAEGGQIRSALALWSTREAPQQAHVVFDSVPTPDLRDWLAALPEAGTQTSWEGVSLKPDAVTVEPIADPKRPVRIWVAAPMGSSIIVRDTVSAIDSVQTKSWGAVIVAPHIDGTVRASVGGTTATGVLRDSLVIKPVLLLGIASWEAKFVLASLEEYGWSVDAHFGITPKGPQGTVIQGPVSPQIDTAHYSAVIALDTSAADFAGPISDFVRQGGGFIAAGDAATLPAFGSLLPATASPQAHGSLLDDSASFTVDSLHQRRALSLMPLVSLKPGAVPIEMRDKQVAVAARRIGTGRVLQVGYNNTWRWRMGGINDPVTAYRSWWSTMVSSIAYAPRKPRIVAASVEQTPMASLVGILGAPKPEKAEPPSPWDDPRLLPALFTLLMTVFFLEWASRRLRGQS